MRFSRLALFLLRLVPTSLAYYVDETCNCYRPQLEEAFAEAENVLRYAAMLSEYCQREIDNPSKGIENPDNFYGRACTHDKNSNLMDEFFGAHNAEMYRALQVAFEAASNAAEWHSDFTIVCGDRHLTRIPPDGWRDTERQGFLLRTGRDRPCDGEYEAIAYYMANGRKVLLICDVKAGRGVNRSRVEFGTRNRYSISSDLTIDAMFQTISHVIIHELIHLGDMNAFPAFLALDQREVYGYAGCKKLFAEKPELARKNADSVALVAAAMYMNQYNVVDGRFQVIKKKRPNPPNPVGYTPEYDMPDAPNG